MDLLEQGKQLTQQGKYEEALDSLVLALENDKENPDIHFYVGLCYSSMGHISYAKFHYQIALSLNPNHMKTKFVWNDIKNIEAERPPERKITRAAAAKLRKTQADEEKTVVAAEPEYLEDKFGQGDAPPERESALSSRYKLTDEKWEQAFPTERLAGGEDDRMGIGTKIILFSIGLALLGLAAFFVYDMFASSGR